MRFEISIESAILRGSQPCARGDTHCETVRLCRRAHRSAHLGWMERTLRGLVQTLGSRIRPATPRSRGRAVTHRFLPSFPLRRFTIEELILLSMPRRRVCGWSLEKAARAAGAQSIAGCDEVGRGPMFGPVVAAAVILPFGCRIKGLTDSKQ